MSFLRDEDDTAEVSKFEAIFKADYKELFDDAKHHQHHRWHLFTMASCVTN